MTINILLSNRSTSSLQTLSREAWARLLSLGRFYGWQPMGTLPPFIHNLRKNASEDRLNGTWDGNYLRTEGQSVRAEDALALAFALERSLDDIPDENPERGLAPDDDLPEWLSPIERALLSDNLHAHPEAGEELPLELLPFEYFAGDAKQNLLDFIRFCKMGEFVIM